MKNFFIFPLVSLGLTAALLTCLWPKAVVADPMMVGNAYAQANSNTGVPTKEVGERRVRRYLSADGSSEPNGNSGIRSADNVLMVMAGAYTNSASYEWKGSGKRTGIAKNDYGFTYLFEQWHNIDVNLRGEIADYQLDDQRPMKLSIMPLWTFPLVETKFPLYFGLGAGLGIFFKQIDGFSPLSLDYQMVMGMRFLNLIENGGLVVEYGIKNHVHLLSAGQLNATAITVGAIFVF